MQMVYIDAINVMWSKGNNEYLLKSNGDGAKTTELFSSIYRDRLQQNPSTVNRRTITTYIINNNLFGI